jgi:drug/metabolite transporter (DMT)-like permease
LGQRVRLRDFAAAFVCYAGVIVIATRGDVLGLRFSNPLGVGLALGSAFVWAGYWIGNTRSCRDPAAGLFLNFLLGLPPVTAAFLLLTEWRGPSIEGLLGGAYVGTFEMGITFLLWQTALRRSDNASKVGNLIFLSPFLSLVFIRLVVGETILPSSLLGLALIVTGLIVQRAGTGP